jgi:Ca2+-binding RTX toxin-like protein
LRHGFEGLLDTMPSNSTSWSNDVAPVAAPDSFTLNASQISQVTFTTFSYEDLDPTSPTYHETLTGTNEVDGFQLNVTANDTDANPNDAGHFWIYNQTDLLDENGNVVGTVQPVNVTDASGNVIRQDVLVYLATPDDSQSHTYHFTYQAGDQWAASDPTPGKTNTLSTAVTVTVTVTGNPVQGQTLVGLNPPNVFTPDSNDPRILFHLAGNDILYGGNNRDTINGGAGADVIHGLNGKDLLEGGTGNDKIFGDNGDDTLNGGDGDDILTGGQGADTFKFDYAFGHDHITDFDVKNDNVVIDHNMWVGWDDFIAHAQTNPNGPGVVVTSDFGDYTITFDNITLKALQGASRDFLFV